MAQQDAHALAAARIDRYLMERAFRLKSGSTKAGSRVCPVITLSRTLGIPAVEIANLVANDLSFHVFDKEVLDAISESTQLGEKIITSLEQGSRSTLDAWIEGFVDYDHRVVDMRNFHHMVSRVIRGISLHGNAVIIGRGANFILGGTNAFRVRLTAPLELRAAAVMKAKQATQPMTLAEAKQELTEHALRRRSFVLNQFHVDIDDPESYDVIFNLREIRADRAASLITETYRRVVGV